ncbi:MAG: type IV pilus biogenesis protein PilM [Candidatus Aminicenantaceae bacterium]
MARFVERLKYYFNNPPLPQASFQLSPHYLSGINVSFKNKKIKHHFISPLGKPVVQPSFNKKNVINESYLEERIKEGKEKLHLTEKRIACLIPEACIKVYAFSFASLPAAREEMEQIIKWQVKKQMPHLPDDIRLSYDVIRSNKEQKILVSLAKASVVQEYEALFSRIGLKVRTIGVATLCLFNLLERKEEDNVMLVNIEEDYISLVAILNSEISLYRFKPFVIESETRLSFSQKINSIVQEVENTVNFVKDRENKGINSFWFRLGMVNQEKGVLSILREKLPYPVKDVETSIKLELTSKEKGILSPLIGQIL